MQLVASALVCFLSASNFIHRDLAENVARGRLRTGDQVVQIPRSVVNIRVRRSAPKSRSLRIASAHPSPSGFKNVKRPERESAVLLQAQSSPDAIAAEVANPPPDRSSDQVKVRA